MSTATPIVTVIIAAYNCSRFLQETVRSALLQSLQSVEIIIVNDASTDLTQSVAHQLMLQDRRVRLITLETNSGPSIARNVGLEHARGDYIAILDADDISMPRRFEQQVAFLNETSTDLCGSWFVEFGRGVPRTVRWPHTEAALRAAMLFQYAILHPSILARREVFGRFRYKPELRLAEDYDLCARAMSEFRLANVPKVLVRYRRHAGQATLSQRAKMEDEAKRIRIQALRAEGISASHNEQRVHNLIRAPSSIFSMADFAHIESWLMKLVNWFDHPEAREVVASQWTRSAVRAAPLGVDMWRRYRDSPLHGLLSRKMAGDFDLAVLAAMRLHYGSRTYELMRRLGVSA